MNKEKEQIALSYKTSKLGGRPTRYPGIEVLNQLYIVEDLTAGEIAAKYNVSKTTVRNWIRKARKEGV